MRRLAEDLLRPAAVDPGEVDHDAVGAFGLDGGLADTKAVEPVLEHGDGGRLDVGFGSPGRDVDQLDDEVAAALEVESADDVDLAVVERPPVEVRVAAGLKFGHGAGQRVVVCVAIQVARPVHEKGDREECEHDDADGPTKD